MGTCSRHHWLRQLLLKRNKKEFKTVEKKTIVECFIAIQIQGVPEYVPMQIQKGVILYIMKNYFCSMTFRKFGISISQKK